MGHTAVVVDKSARIRGNAQVEAHGYWLYEISGKSYWGMQVYRPSEGASAEITEAEHNLTLDKDRLDVLAVKFPKNERYQRWAEKRKKEAEKAAELEKPSTPELLEQVLGADMGTRPDKTAVAIVQDGVLVHAEQLQGSGKTEMGIDKVVGAIFDALEIPKPVIVLPEEPKDVEAKVVEPEQLPEPKETP